MRTNARLNTRGRNIRRVIPQQHKAAVIEAPTINFKVDKDIRTAAATVTVSSEFSDRTVKHVVELSELTQVNQTLLELCNELLND